ARLHQPTLHRRHLTAVGLEACRNAKSGKVCVSHARTIENARFVSVSPAPLQLGSRAGGCHPAARIAETAVAAPGLRSRFHRKDRRTEGFGCSPRLRRAMPHRTRWRQREPPIALLDLLSFCPSCEISGSTGSVNEAVNYGHALTGELVE